MSKFKEGDYVTLREDARYPTDGSLWSTLDKSLICGDLFKVKMLGSYSWLKNPIQDCISVNNGVGWMPESCFDPVQIPKFKVGDWVECYRLPNENDWDVTNCGKISHNLKVGEKYEVKESWDTCNIRIINGESRGYYPPTIFRKTKSSTQELPEKWCVACKYHDEDTPELLEWRKFGWTGVGYINNDGLWSNEVCDNIISYETFLEKVYKPWKALQSKVSNNDVISLPDKWVYSLKNETADRIKLIQEWRLSVCRSYYIKYLLYNHHSVCNHEDGSYYYAGNSTNYIKSQKDVIEINKEMFDKFILQPWIDNGKPSINVPDKKVPIESPPSLTPSTTPSSLNPGIVTTSLSDTPVVNSTPHLIVNKSKKRLFSTEVQELNVNLKLLKTQ